MIEALAILFGISIISAVIILAAISSNRKKKPTIIPMKDLYVIIPPKGKK